jgi:hypothetical protein
MVRTRALDFARLIALSALGSRAAPALPREDPRATRLQAPELVPGDPYPS